MNILFDSHTFDVGPQGTTTFLAELVNALPEAARERALALDLTCAAEDPRNVDRFVTVPHRFETMRGGFVARNLLSLPRLTRTTGVDAVLSQYVRPFRSHVPTISAIHDVLFLDFPELFDWRYRVTRRLLFGWAARNSDVVITISDYSRERIAHHFGLPFERIDVLPCGANVTTPLPTERPERIPGAPIRLLYVSRFETRKRQHWCVAAARALAARGQPVVLTLVGSATGAYADSVRAAIAADVVPGAEITIRSDVSQTELETMFAATDLFLFPSRGEGFGLPVIEAAAHGVPCVVAANTALRELSGHYAGIGVETDDETAFTAGVAAAAERLPILREEALALAPRTRAAYRWSDVARNFLSILDRRGLLP